jgi:hypothetical protein
MAPALDFGLEFLIGISLEIFPYRPPDGRALLREFLSDERVAWHGVIKAPLARSAQERKMNGHVAAVLRGVIGRAL